MKTTILLISLVISIVVVPAFSQSNFKEGYIIKANGDTLKGFIEFRSDYKNARGVNFKATLAGETIRYEPDSLRYYQVLNKSYFAKNIQYDEANKKLKQKVFLEALATGRANLYYFKDVSLEEQFYIEKDSIFQRISSEERTITNEDGRTFITRDNKYIRVLNNLFKDCPSWNANTEFEFVESALKRVVRRYNNCFTENNPTKLSDKSIDTINKKIQVAYIFQLGIGHSTVLHTVEPVWSNQIENSTSVYGLTAGIAFNFVVPRLNKNISLELGINYNQKGVKSTISHIDIYYKDTYYYRTTDYRMNFIDFSAMAKYTYPKGKIKPFIGLGGLVGYILNSGSAFKITGGSNDSPTIFVYDNYLHGAILPLEIGFCAETGVMIPVSINNKIIISFRYELSSIKTLSYDYPYSFSNEVLQFKVGYRFR